MSLPSGCGIRRTRRPRLLARSERGGKPAQALGQAGAAQARCRERCCQDRYPDISPYSQTAALTTTAHRNSQSALWSIFPTQERRNGLRIG